MLRRIAAALVLPSVAALAFAGCGGSSGGESGSSTGVSGTATTLDPSGPPASGATFSYAIGTDPGALDPATNITSEATRLFTFAYDFVVVPDADNRIVGNLATSWRVAPRVVTFQIRDDVTCSDGSPVTPSVIGQNLEYFQSPDVQYPALGTLDYRVVADDARGRLTIRFGEPTPFVLQALGFVPIVCGRGLRDRSLLKRQTSGSGPFVLSEAVPNDHYAFDVREGYRWGPDGAATSEPGTPARLVLRVVPNETTSANLLLSGDLTAAVVRGSEQTRLTAQKAPSLAKALGITQMFFNEADGRPAADPAVRRALTMATDRASVAKVGKGTVGDSIMAPALNPCPAPAQGDAIPAHDPGAAAQLLDEAGWRRGGDGIRVKDGQRLEIRMLGLTGIGTALRAGTELIAQSWRDLGVDVETRVMAEGPAVESLSDGSWDAFPLLNVGTTAPSQFVPFVSGATPPKGSNWGHVENAAYDRLVAEAATTVGEEATCRKWDEAEAALVGAADVVPMVALDTVWFTDGATSFEVSGLGIVPTSIRMHEG